MNLFAPAADPEPALAALPSSVAWTPRDSAAISRDGQVRLWWGDTPIDLFFDYAPIHRDAAKARRTVPFEGEQIQVLAPLELAVFKAMFDRTRDWADIEEMIAAGSLDPDELHQALRGMAGADDDRHRRVEEAARRARGE